MKKKSKALKMDTICILWFCSDTCDPHLLGTHTVLPLPAE